LTREVVTPPSVLAATGDLAFRSRIDLALGRAGIPVRFVAAGRLASAVAASRPSLILVDYAGLGEAEWSELSRIKQDPATRDLPLLAYGPHLDHEARERARRAGADALLSNGEVAANLPAIVTEWMGRAPGRAS
jgi:CheY-like chemotaxis protein